MKRRTSGLLLSLLMLMSLTACGGEVQGSAKIGRASCRERVLTSV